MERTLIILKPDAVQRGLCGEILSRFEKKGLQIVGAKFMTISQQRAETHYEPHKGKPFYPGLVKFMTSSRLNEARSSGGVESIDHALDLAFLSDSARITAWQQPRWFRLMSILTSRRESRR